jgi:transketolase
MEKTIRKTEAHAAQMRYDIVRMIENVGSGHPGGSLSCTDILACLYFGDVLNIRPDEPKWPDRDRCILAKGHAAPALYAALARRGFFSSSELAQLRQIDSMLEGHPDCVITPGVEMTTGPLGLGLSAAAGMALAGRMDKKDYYVYVVSSDGELNEGQVWEAAQFAAHYNLDHIINFLDYNGFQFDGSIEDVIRPYDIAAKWRAFGWDVVEIDGHDHRQILEAIARAKENKGKPHYIVSKTEKGKGVPVMENSCNWHSLMDKQVMLDSIPELAKEVKRYADVLDAQDIW